MTHQDGRQDLPSELPESELDERHERLCRLVFGELEGAERAALEAELERDPVLRAEHEALLATAGLVTDLAPVDRCRRRLPIGHGRRNGRGRRVDVVIVIGAGIRRGYGRREPPVGRCRLVRRRLDRHEGAARRGGEAGGATSR